MALADDFDWVACIATKETAEKIPLVLTQGALVEFDESASGKAATTNKENCPHMKVLRLNACNTLTFL